jgi:hypothetical protein
MVRACRTTARAGSGPALEPPPQPGEHSARRSGSGMRGRSPDSARTRSPGTQPSGATLNTPSSRRSTPRRPPRRDRRGGGTAMAGRPRRGAGRTRTPARWPGASRRRRQRTAGRSTQVARPPRAVRHCSTSSSAEASWRAKTNSTSGRSGASSVSGTGLFAAAPYTIADDTNTTCVARAGRRSPGRAPRFGGTLPASGTRVVVAAAEIDHDDTLGAGRRR